MMQGSSFNDHYRRLEENDAPEFDETGGENNAFTSPKKYNIANYESFCQNLYLYHSAHGYCTFILRSITRVFSILVGITLFFIATLCFDWQRFYMCMKEKKCQDVFVWFVKDVHWFWWLYNVFMFLYFLLLSYKLYRNICMAKRMKTFCKDCLELNNDVFAQMSWKEVTERMAEFQRQGLFGADKLYTVPMIDAVILRNDNILSALFRHDKLELEEHKNIYYSTFLVFIIDQCIIRNCYTSHSDGAVKPTLNDAFLRGNTEGFKKLMRIIALLCIPILPFILIFNASMTFFTQMQFLASKQTQNFYKWSGYSKLKLRSHNQYPHQLHLKLEEHKTPVEVSFKSFPDHSMIEVIKQIVFPTATLVGLMILLTLYDSGILFEIVIFNRSLFVYLSILTPIVVCCRSYLSAQGSVTMEEKKKAIWQIHKCREDDTFDSAATDGMIHAELKSIKSKYEHLYLHKIWVFLSEIISVLLLPKILYDIGNRGETILNFLAENLTVSDVGVVYFEEFIGYSTNCKRDKPSSPLLRPMEEKFNGVNLRMAA